MNLKATLEALISIRAAGYKLVNSKSIGTDDGSCWHATLAYGKQPIVEVSNGGYGGPDVLRFAPGAKTPASELGKLLSAFTELQAVQDYLRQSKIDLAKMCQSLDARSDEELAAHIAELGEAKFDFKDDEDLGAVVGWMGDVGETIKSMKRQLKTKVIVIDADEADGSYMSYKCADTPQNRAKIQAAHKKPIGCFAADLLAQL